MSKLYAVPETVANNALIDADSYDSMYQQSVEDNEGFWAGQAARIDWF